MTIPSPNLEPRKEMALILSAGGAIGTIAVRDEASRDYTAYYPTNAALDQLEALISHREALAEKRMGEAIIQYHRKTHQWEKVESLIQSYEMQKRENPYGLAALTEDQS